MANTIDGGFGANNATQAKRSQTSQQSKVNGVASGGEQKGQGDSISMSDTAATLRNLEQRLADVPEINQEKIDSIKSALASGSYTIDAAQVAKKFVEIEKALGKL